MVDAEDTVAEMVWHCDIACPQTTPREMGQNKHKANRFKDGIWWRSIPEPSTPAGHS